MAEKSHIIKTIETILKSALNSAFMMPKLYFCQEKLFALIYANIFNLRLNMFQNSTARRKLNWSPCEHYEHELYFSKPNNRSDFFFRRKDQENQF